MDPIVLQSALPADLRAGLLADVEFIVRNGDYDTESSKGRVVSNNPVLDAYSEYFLPIVKHVFGEDNLLPSYSCWARYAGPGARLEKHKDINACTFTVDYCVSQLEPWELYVEGVPYLLEENDALLFMGEDQEHWRPAFPIGNRVEMIFFHYARPDHWFFDPSKERPECFR